MRQYELVERVTRYNPDADEALLNKAYVYAMQKHGTQLRASGDPYFSHPLEVAAILTDLKLDDATIAVGAAARHDRGHRRHPRARSTRCSARISAAWSKASPRSRSSTSSRRRRRRRKTSASCCWRSRPTSASFSSSSPTACTICARCSSCRPRAASRIAEETMEIYAPLAGRMGMQEMREELEELAFRVVNPEAYETIVDRLAELGVKQRGADRTRSRPNSAGGSPSAASRPQSSAGRSGPIRSSARWSERRSASSSCRTSSVSASSSQTIEECYAALGVVHTTWPTVPGRFKDYISTPKQNEYRSIHTTVIGPRHQRVELQIRTAEMDQIAEYGIAAHALYKDGVGPAGMAPTPQTAMAGTARNACRLRRRGPRL